MKLFLYISFAIATTGEAAFNIAFEPEGQPGRVITRKEWKAVSPSNTEERANALTKAMLNPGETNFSLVGREGVILASMCTLVSTNTVKSRIHAICGMFGFSVPTNRSDNPAAWWPIPEDDFQSFDHVTTTFNSWMGLTSLTNAATAGEYGSRIVVNIAGLFPVSAYTYRIATTLPGYDDTTLPAGTNTSQMESQFSENFVGINFGSNGVCESFRDVGTGNYVEGGDDTVYVTGEYPSTVSYTWWARLGAAAFTTITAPSGFDVVNQSFITSTQSFTGELMRNGIVVASKKVSEAQPSLRIQRHPSASTMSLAIQGGQLRIPYTLLSSPAVSGLPWTTHEASPLSSGATLTISNSATRFFRLKTGFP